MGGSELGLAMKYVIVRPDPDFPVKLNPTAPLKVDINKAPDQFGLRTPEQIQWLRDAIKPDTTRIVAPKTLR